MTRHVVLDFRCTEELLQGPAREVQRRLLVHSVSSVRAEPG